MILVFFWQKRRRDESTCHRTPLGYIYYLRRALAARLDPKGNWAGWRGVGWLEVMVFILTDLAAYHMVPVYITSAAV